MPLVDARSQDQGVNRPELLVREERIQATGMAIGLPEHFALIACHRPPTPTSGDVEIQDTDPESLVVNRAYFILLA